LRQQLSTVRFLKTRQAPMDQWTWTTVHYQGSGCQQEDCCRLCNNK